MSGLEQQHFRTPAPKTAPRDPPTVRALHLAFGVLVAADAFVGELTRGNICTFWIFDCATAE